MNNLNNDSNEISHHISYSKPEVVEEVATDHVGLIAAIDKTGSAIEKYDQEFFDNMVGNEVVEVVHNYFSHQLSLVFLLGVLADACKGNGEVDIINDSELLVTLMDLHEAILTRGVRFTDVNIYLGNLNSLGMEIDSLFDILGNEAGNKAIDDFDAIAGQPATYVSDIEIPF